MTSRNTEELLDFLRNKEVGDKFDIATSQYASTEQTGYATFDFWSTAQAVRGLIKKGILKGECGWRYYAVELLQKIPAREVGRTFKIKLEGGEVVEAVCITWDCERREFKVKGQAGYVWMDWMDYIDQASLGRIWEVR